MMLLDRFDCRFSILVLPIEQNLVIRAMALEEILDVGIIGLFNKVRME